jgi:molybdate/tungstate transport system substrate-binding protein
VIGRLTFLITGAALALPACKSQSGEVLIFHAASLSGALGDVRRELAIAAPDLDLHLEPSGSQVAARKVAELNRPGDLVLVADAQILRELLIPQHADWEIAFATNEIVLAHREHSRYTEAITPANWPEILLKPGVRIGRADEALAPIGYQTLLCWKLAEGFYRDPPAPDLARQLAARCPPEHVVPDVAELVALLEARAVDYVFVYRSIAEEHNLKVTQLPPEVNLGDRAQAARYRSVSVPVRLSRAQGIVEVHGAPILAGLTIPRSAPHPAGALRVAAFLLGPAGQGILRRHGHRPLGPAESPDLDRLPAELRGLVAPGASPP